MATYYADVCSDELVRLQRSEWPASPRPGDTFACSIASRCPTCQRVYTVPGTARVGSFGTALSHVDNPADLDACTGCRVRTEQGVLW